MARPQLSPDDFERNRDDIADAALRMVQEEGLPSLTLRRLAQRVGCSYAKPYSYYRDKEHLLDAVRGLAFDRLAAFAGEAIESGTVSGETYLQFARENPELFRIMFELRQDYTSAETRAAEDAAWKVCARPFHQAVAAGLLEGDPELIAHVVWAALHGLASLDVANKLTHGKSVDEVAAAIRSIVNGFRPGAPKEELAWLS